MAFIGIVGARKFRDREAVEELVISLPENSIIVTSGCEGVCSWTHKKAKQRDMDVLVYAPDLTNIRSNFDIPKRYYQRNRELIEKCDFVHAFISKECGYTGGTCFEIKYAAKLRIPVKIHWEKGIEEIIYQCRLPFQSEEQVFSTTWQNFFCEVVALKRRCL